MSNKPDIFILQYGNFSQLSNPHLEGAYSLHVTTGLVIYGKNGARQGMIIDPGMAVDFNEHKKVLTKLGLSIGDITHLLITHFHQDHTQALAKYPDGTHIFHYGSSSILGSEEYGGKVYANGFIEIPEIKFALFENAHTKKDTVYIVDSANEGMVAFVGDLAFSLFDGVPKDAQKGLDVGASVDPARRWQALFDFYHQHPEVEGYYLGHYGRKVMPEEIKKYLEEWK